MSPVIVIELVVGLLLWVVVVWLVPLVVVFLLLISLISVVISWVISELGSLIWGIGLTVGLLGLFESSLVALIVFSLAVVVVVLVICLVLMLEVH